MCSGLEFQQKVKVRGRELVYIGRTARKMKGRFDLNKRPSSKRHVYFPINDLRPTCQGWGVAQKVGLNHHPMGSSTH